VETIRKDTHGPMEVFESSTSKPSCSQQLVSISETTSTGVVRSYWNHQRKFPGNHLWRISLRGNTKQIMSVTFRGSTFTSSVKPGSFNFGFPSQIEQEPLCSTGVERFVSTLLVRSNAKPEMPEATLR